MSSDSVEYDQRSSVTASRTAAQLQTHEAVCAERYSNILTVLDGMGGRVGRIENIMMRLVWAALAILLSVLGYILATSIHFSAHVG